MRRGVRGRGGGGGEEERVVSVRSERGAEGREVGEEGGELFE